MNATTENVNVIKPIVGDLADPANRLTLARKIASDIDAWCVATYDDGHRTHLGASLIGRECSRFLWYTFRWVKSAKFDARMLRLFQRGHREEAHMIAMLEGIGATVSFEDTSVDMRLIFNSDTITYRYDLNPGLAKFEHDVTGDAAHETSAAADGVFPEYPQHRVSGCEGHFGGSMDAQLYLPELYGIPLMFINEYKTQGTGPKFAALQKNGVRVEKPDHFTQMSIYGWKKQVKYGVYMAVNKNDDTLHIEVVELDWALAQRMELKAHNIIFTRTPPQKLSESIAHSTCCYCDMKDVCHQAAPYEKNCRSCDHSEAAPNKQWGCHKYQALIPPEVIKNGCDAWEPAL